MSAVFHFHTPLPLHKSAVYSMSKFIYGVERGALSNKGPDPSPKSFSRWLLLNVTGFFFGLKPWGWGGGGVDTIEQEVGQEKSHFFSSSVRIQPRPLCPTADIAQHFQSQAFVGLGYCEVRSGENRCLERQCKIGA